MSPEKKALIDARALLEDPAKWIKGADALEDPEDAAAADVAALDAHDVLATCWCLGGAVERVSPDGKIATRACDILSGIVNETAICYWNDDPGTEHGHVLALLDQAIEATP